MRDLELQSCSLAARGLWKELLCRMHFATPRGYLRTAAGPIPDRQIPRMVNAAPGEDVMALLSELESAGVFSRDADGAIYNRRMARQAEISAKRAEAGRKGAEVALAKQAAKVEQIAEAVEVDESVPFPANLDTPAFRAAWDEWTAYRRERKLSPWKPRTVKAKLAELSAWGAERAVAAIQSSIANGYQGIFEPKGGPHRTDHLAWRKGGDRYEIAPDPGPSIPERLAALAESIPDTAPNAARLRAEILGLSGSFEDVEARLGEIETEVLSAPIAALSKSPPPEIVRAVAAVPKTTAAEVRANLIRQRARKLTGIPHLSLVSDAATPRRKSA